MHGVGRMNDYHVGVANNALNIERGFITALGHALSKASAEQGVRIKSTFEIEEIQTIRDRDVNEFSRLMENIVLETSHEFDGFRLYDVYWERSCPSYDVYVMVSMPRLTPNSGAKPPITAMDGLWRSMLLPGWGQLYKGQSTAGWTIMGLEAVSLGTGIISAILAQRHYADASSATRQSDQNFFLERGDQFNIAAIVSFSVAAGVYVYNVAHASLSEPHVQYYASKPAPAEPFIGIAFRGTGLDLILNF